MGRGKRRETLQTSRSPRRSARPTKKAIVDGAGASFALNLQCGWFRPGIAHLLRKRPRDWMQVTGEAVFAVADGEDERRISLPTGVDLEGRRTDSAIGIVRALDAHLGHELIWSLVDSARTALATGRVEFANV
jgi:hypothetical protein